MKIFAIVFFAILNICKYSQKISSRINSSLQYNPHKTSNHGSFLLNRKASLEKCWNVRIRTPLEGNEENRGNRESTNALPLSDSQVELPCHYQTLEEKTCQKSEIRGLGRTLYSSHSACNDSLVWLSPMINCFILPQRVTELRSVKPWGHWGERLMSSLVSLLDILLAANWPRTQDNEYFLLPMSLRYSWSPDEMSWASRHITSAADLVILVEMGSPYPPPWPRWGQLQKR